MKVVDEIEFVYVLTFREPLIKLAMKLTQSVGKGKGKLCSVKYTVQPLQL